jgi:hypothetical protein
MQRLCMASQGVSEETISRLFRRFPGMEYCDLKKDRETGKSKVSVREVCVCVHVCEQVCLCVR